MNKKIILDLALIEYGIYDYVVIGIVIATFITCFVLLILIALGKIKL